MGILVAGTVERVPLAEHHESVVLGQSQVFVEHHFGVCHMTEAGKVFGQLVVSHCPRQIANKQFVRTTSYAAGHDFPIDVK